jgi:glutaredoxin
MKNNYRRLNLILTVLTALLLLIVTQLTVFAAINSQIPFLKRSNQEFSIPTPTANSDEDDICGLKSEDCEDSANSDSTKSELNFGANSFAEVAIILFWMEDCVHCEEVLNTVLPEIEFQFNDQVYIFPIELRDIETVDTFYQMAERLGVPKNNIGVPLVIIGRQVLTGDQIKTDLSGWIETYLQENTGYMLAIPEFADQLPESIRRRQINPEDFPEENQAARQTPVNRSQTFLLAIGIPFMGVLLILFYFLFLRSARQKQ